MMLSGRMSVWSLGRWASFIACILHATQIAEGAPDDVLLVFCQCPFGYYQASRFPVLLQFTPPCGEIESTRSATLCGRWKTYGLKCVRCHPNCYGCDGPTDAHCDSCADGFFNASYMLPEATLRRQSEYKRLSSSENLQFFNEDDWDSEFGKTETMEDKGRDPTGSHRRQERNVAVLDYDSGSDDSVFVTAPDVTSGAVVTTNVPEEAVDDNPTKHYYDDEATTKIITELKDFILDEELIPLSTPNNENVELVEDISDVMARYVNENYDDSTNSQTKSKLERDDRSDSGSGEVLIEDEFPAQLASPSSVPPPTLKIDERLPPTPSNYWYLDTLHPVPVKRSGGTTHKNEFENVQSSSSPEPGSLPTPAALLKATSSQAELPQGLVSWTQNWWSVVPTTTTASQRLHTTRTTQPDQEYSNTEGSSKPTTEAESSTTYLQNRTTPTVRSTRRKSTMTSTLPPYVTVFTNPKTNSTERQSGTRRRNRKTTAQPVVTKESIDVTTVKPTHPLSSRSTVKDSSYNINVSNSTNNNDTKPNVTLNSENEKYETKFLAPVTDSVSPREVANFYRCVPACPDGTYKDLVVRKCQICDKKCRTCVGPTFMNCTSCDASSVQAASSPLNVIGQVLTVTCLSECPENHFQYNGTCTPCHDYCNGCYGFGPAQCLHCRHQATSSKSGMESQPSPSPLLCIEKDDDSESPLEFILPLAFVCFLVVVTTIICIRWNCKPSDLCFFNPDLCNKLRKKEDKENLSALPKKSATTGKARNEYSPSPPSGTCPKCHVNTTDDGYELPLHPSSGSITNYAPSSLHSTSSSANHTMIKPRRNDPLPLTPLELDAMQRRENSSSSSSNVYKNIPSTSPAASQASEPKSAIEAIPGTSSQSEEDRPHSDNELQLILTDTSYANSEGLYANC